MKNKNRIEELDTELGILEATYDVESEKEWKEWVLSEIRIINKELRKLGGGKHISSYTN